MKVKMQLDLASIKNWLLGHGEKLALGIVAIVVLLLTYSAIQREALDADKQPDNLKTLASRVDSHVRNSTWDSTRDSLQVVNYTDRAKTRLVDLEAYPLARPFNPPETDPKAKRDVPELLGIEELRAGSGYDFFLVKPTGASQGGSSGRMEVLPQPWAVVTGLVPLAGQHQEFERAFRQAVGGQSNRDVPQYVAPLLQRTIVDPADPKKVEWADVPDIKPFEERWVQPGATVVAPALRQEFLTGRLGPLANKKQRWSESIGHPKIPRTSPQDNQASRPDAEEVIEYQLLRAFDYAVEPGKKYRYRVILRLQNPNFGLRPQQLKDPQSAREEFVQSEPSAATTVITIPDGHRVLAGKVDAGTRYSEPSATLLVTAIDKAQGLEGATELLVRRGTVANTPQAKMVQAKKPGTTGISEVSLEFRSNALVLDIYGGRNLSNRRRAEPIASPGEVLLLDAEGNMIVRSEIDDWAQYQSTIVRDPAAEKAKKSALEKDDKPKKRPPIRSRRNR